MIFKLAKAEKVLKICKILFKQLIITKELADFKVSFGFSVDHVGGAFFSSDGDFVVTSSSFFIDLP